MNEAGGHPKYKARTRALAPVTDFFWLIPRLFTIAPPPDGWWHPNYYRPSALMKHNSLPMKTLPKTEALFDKLRAFDLFDGVADEALRWLHQQGVYVEFDDRGLIIGDGQPVDHMLIILEGGLTLIRESNGRKREMGMYDAPGVTGVLPFSRMVEASANGYATGPTKVLRLHRDCFTEMVNVSYPLAQALVSVMTNRVRDFQQMRLMDEKLMALGKMSAGLAHELNNPASAMVSASKDLHRHLQQTPDRFKSVMLIQSTPDMVDRINEVLFERIQAGATCTTSLSLMQREERTDDLVDWFDDHGIDGGDEVADTFVDWDFLPEHLDKIAEILPEKSLAAVLWWIETNLTTERLVDEIQISSKRISELVRSIKTYSHMDQDPSLEFTDLNSGIESTVTMLYHQVKKQGVTLVKQLDANIPSIKAMVGEMNQVWTNMISNALDALKESGNQIIIRSFQERDCVCVEIEDNGPGIPEDVQTRIFEPFYTTKGVGEGTGMGLDIVRRVINHHRGSITMESEPGRTLFRVCLPAE